MRHSVDSAMTNQRVKYLGQRSSSSEVIVRTLTHTDRQTHTHSRSIAPCGLIQWPVKNTPAVMTSHIMLIFVAGGQYIRRTSRGGRPYAGRCCPRALRIILSPCVCVCVRVSAPVRMRSGRRQVPAAINVSTAVAAPSTAQIGNIRGRVARGVNS